jgi:hypothetical protein
MKPIGRGSSEEFNADARTHGKQQISFARIAERIVTLSRTRGPHVVILRGSRVYVFSIESAVAENAMRDYAHRIVGIYTSSIAVQDVVDDLGEAFADWSRRDC